MNKIKNKKLLFLAIFGFIVFVSSSVVVSISIASEGSRYLKLEEEIKTVESENRELQAKVVSEDSLTKISEKADEYGLSKPEKIVYLGELKHLAAKLP
jgi:cell division protein FtsL